MNNRVKKILSLTRPLDCHGYTKVRIGKSFDGGYVIPYEILDQVEVLHSYGIADDISFELHILDIKRMKAYLYDHTIDELPSVPEDKKDLITWHKEGMSRDSYNHQAPSAISLLKMDIEGAEWESLINANLTNVACIAMEMHNLCDVGRHDQYIKTLEHIGQDFIPYHIHGNNCGGYCGIPNVMEITYINKRYVSESSICNDHYPLAIDMPNSYDKPDIDLHWLGKNMFTTDWFSRRIGEWWSILRSYINKPINYLEIGTWEGRSLSWVCRHILKNRDSRAWAIDIWEGDLYNRYLESTRDIADRVTSIRSTSRDALKSENIICRQYDIIYIDGDHHSMSALEDAILSFPLLKDGGVLIFDDYLGGDIKSLSSPHIGISSFLNVYNMDVIHAGYQIFLRKCPSR